MINSKIYKKIIALNASMDLVWVGFAAYAWAYADVPYYIALMPILYNLFSYVYGLRMVANYNKESLGTTGASEVYNKDRQKIDDMLYTIAEQNP